MVSKFLSQIIVRKVCEINLSVGLQIFKAWLLFLDNHDKNLKEAIQK